MIMTIITLFVLYTICCCLDGQDLKPLWKKWLSIRLDGFSEYLCPKYIPSPFDRVPVDITHFYSTKLESMVYISEDELCRYPYFIPGSQSEFNKMIVERKIMDAKMICAERIKKAMVKDGFINFEIDHESRWPGIIVIGSCQVGHKE